MSYQKTGIELLTSELILRIFQFLSSRDLAVVARICSKWKILAADDRVWKVLCSKDDKVFMKHNSIPSGYSSWKMFYRQLQTG
jgi:hypothetical protein